MRRSLTFDVTRGVGSDEELTQEAWRFLPQHPADVRGVLLCLAGGTYDKHYWHIDIDGYPGYSFGEHLATPGSSSSQWIGPGSVAARRAVSADA